MLSVDIIHLLHADTNSYLLLVWKRSEAKGVNYMHISQSSNIYRIIF